MRQKRIDEVNNVRDEVDNVRDGEEVDEVDNVSKTFLKRVRTTPPVQYSSTFSTHSKQHSENSTSDLSTKLEFLDKTQKWKTNFLLIETFLHKTQKQRLDFFKRKNTKSGGSLSSHTKKMKKKILHQKNNKKIKPHQKNEKKAKIHQKNEKKSSYTKKMKKKSNYTKKMKKKSKHYKKNT